MSYTDYLTQRLLRQSEYLEERYGAVHNAPPEERERLADYAIDLARVMEAEAQEKGETCAR